MLIFFVFLLKAFQAKLIIFLHSVARYLLMYCRFVVAGGATIAVPCCAVPDCEESHTVPSLQSSYHHQSASSPRKPEYHHHIWPGVGLRCWLGRSHSLTPHNDTYASAPGLGCFHLNTLLIIPTANCFEAGQTVVPSRMGGYLNI